MFLPFDPRQIGIDAIGVIRTAAEKTQGAEAAIADVAGKDRYRCQRVQLSRLIVELHLPEKLELALLHAVLGDLGIRAHPGRAMRVAAGGRPVTHATTELG